MIVRQVKLSYLEHSTLREEDMRYELSVCQTWKQLMDDVNNIKIKFKKLIIYVSKTFATCKD